jgi:hypothetical protein
MHHQNLYLHVSFKSLFTSVIQIFIYMCHSNHYCMCQSYPYYMCHSNLYHMWHSNLYVPFRSMILPKVDCFIQTEFFTLDNSC